MADAPAPALETTMQKVPIAMGMMPTTFDEGFRMATALAQSELVPKNFRNKREDVLVAIQIGVEIGLAPMQALQSIAVINGRPSLWGDAVLAVIMASPLYEDHDEWFEVGGQRRDGLVGDDLKVESTVAVCQFKRRGKATPVVRRFSVGQAKKAGLLGKEGPWTGYPDRMLAMRSRGFAARDAFPDLLRGIHTAEEVRDLPAVDEIHTTSPKLVHRLSERAERTDRDDRDDRDAAAGTEPPATTAAAPVILGPLTVLRVEQLLGGACATLAGGVQVWIPDEADAKELGKFAGTDHALRITADHDGPWPIAANSWRLVSFEIAH